MAMERKHNIPLNSPTHSEIILATKMCSAPVQPGLPSSDLAWAVPQIGWRHFLLIITLLSNPLPLRHVLGY